MVSAPATSRVVGPGRATAPIQAFAAELLAEPLPTGVRKYVWGDSTRDYATAEQHRTATPPRSAAHWGDSPHHYDPAPALDVFPIDDVTGNVSTLPRHYDRIVVVAERMGLKSGRAWSDHPHVQEHAWRDQVDRVAGAADRARRERENVTNQPGGGFDAAVLLAVLAVGGWLAWVAIGGVR